MPCFVTKPQNHCFLDVSPVIVSRAVSEFTGPSTITVTATGFSADSADEQPTKPEM
jgi:hypothetical protein